MTSKKSLSRREFLKFSALALGGLAISGNRPAKVFSQSSQIITDDPYKPIFPENTPLGRICVGGPGTPVTIFSEPHSNSTQVRRAWFDEIFLWKKQVVTKPDQINIFSINQRWVETEEGYIFADVLQPVKHQTHTPLAELPQWSDGTRGMWVEITTPYSPMDLVKPKENHQWWIRDPINIYPRVHYSQIFWAFDIRQHPSTGNTQYCLKQGMGSLPDVYWVDASVCKQILPEEISPIHPDAEDKRIVIRIRDRGLSTLTCYEGNEEVYYALTSVGRISEETGKSVTPLGTHTPWRKLVSMHYSADNEFNDFDIPGVGWNFGIEPNGVYIHSTYWHNRFGNMNSAGCINLTPEDAKWVWRWVEPYTPYEYPGELTWQGLGISTPVTVEHVG